MKDRKQKTLINKDTICKNKPKVTSLFQQPTSESIKNLPKQDHHLLTNAEAYVPVGTIHIQAITQHKIFYTCIFYDMFLQKSKLVLDLKKA